MLLRFIAFDYRLIAVDFRHWLSSSLHLWLSSRLSVHACLITGFVISLSSVIGYYHSSLAFDVSIVHYWCPSLPDYFFVWFPSFIATILFRHWSLLFHTGRPLISLITPAAPYFSAIVSIICWLPRSSLIIWLMLIAYFFFRRSLNFLHYYAHFVIFFPPFIRQYFLHLYRRYCCRSIAHMLPMPRRRLLRHDAWYLICLMSPFDINIIIILFFITIDCHLAYAGFAFARSPLIFASFRHLLFERLHTILILRHYRLIDFITSSLISHCHAMFH